MDNQKTVYANLEAIKTGLMEFETSRFIRGSVILVVGARHQLCKLLSFTKPGLYFVLEDKILELCKLMKQPIPPCNDFERLVFVCCDQQNLLQIFTVQTWELIGA